MESILQEISDKLTSWFTLPSCDDLFELIKSGFFSLFSSIYNFLFIDCKSLIFSIGNNFFGLVYNSINYGNFFSFFVGCILVVCIFKVVVHIVRG